MATFTKSDALQGAEFVDANLTGARFVGADLSGVVMRGVDVQNSTGASLAAPTGVPQIRMACAPLGTPSGARGLSRLSVLRRCRLARSTFRSVASGRLRRH